MNERTCVVLDQYRSNSEYNDFIGKFYHFPNKYLKQLTGSNIEFIYFEPAKKGMGTFFGCGRIGKVFQDKQVEGSFFAEILDYKPFAHEIPSRDESGKLREDNPSYNVRNAVRRIPPTILDDICLEAGIPLNFIPDAHLIRVLGEELIASEVVGVLELIKNSYDANANTCRVRIEKVSNILPTESEYLFNDYEGPIIVIEDDGIGMDKNAIINGWMRPASTIKTNVKDRLKREKEKAVKEGNLGTYKSLVGELKKQHGGRIPLGEKGVGRFATHRLGSKVIITTKTKDIDFEYLIEIDWDRLNSNNEEVVDLSSIGFVLKKQMPSRDYGKNNSGTRLIIYGGRSGFEFTDSIVKDINRSVSKLKSPRSSSQVFNIIFECPQILDLEETSVFNEVPPIFSIDVLVDEHGKSEYELDFTPPGSVPLSAEKISKRELDLRKQDEDNPDYWVDNSCPNKKKTPKCGAFFLHMDIWYRSKPWVDGTYSVNQLSDYLDDFGGISIYRDSLNIFPAEWGAEVDWLTLSKRHIKKGGKLSYYNIIGNLELEQSTNLDIVDKTDRQGLLNNEAFRDLTQLVRSVLFEAEVHFIGKRNDYKKATSGYIREPKKLGEEAKQGSQLIKRFAERYDIINDSAHILEGYGEPETNKERLLNLSDSLKGAQKSLEVMQEVQDLLTEQAGFGLAIGVAVHEIAKITSNFYNGISKMLKKGVDENTLKELKSSSSSLKNELKRFGPMRAIRNERPIEFSIEKAIKFGCSVRERKLKKIGINLHIDIPESFSVCTRYGAIVQIISNLLDNSCYWLSDQNISERKILIQVDPLKRTLLFADSGPDIDNSIRQYLFQPGYSLKIPQSGLGLYICKHYMQSMKGDIYEANVKDRVQAMDGAHFILDFSHVPAGKDS